MLKSAAVRVLRACARSLRDPGFWWLLLGVIVAALALGVLIVLAVGRYDAFLRLRPLICSEGVTDRQFFIVAMAAPVWFVFMLATLGELWEQIEVRRAGRRPRWFHFWLFLSVVVALAALVLFELGC